MWALVIGIVLRQLLTAAGAILVSQGVSPELAKTLTDAVGMGGVGAIIGGVGILGAFGWSMWQKYRAARPPQ